MFDICQVVRRRLDRVHAQACASTLARYVCVYRIRFDSASFAITRTSRPIAAPIARRAVKIREGAVKKEARAIRASNARRVSKP